MIEFDFESILNSINTGIISRDENLRVQKMNVAAETILGVDHGDFNSLSLDDIVPTLRDEDGGAVSEEDYPPVKLSGRAESYRIVSYS